MNNTFNLNRFSHYFKKHTVDNIKIYTLSTVVLLGILGLALGFMTLIGLRATIDWQMSVFLFCLTLGGAIFTSLIFADFGDKKKAIPVLTLPVSSIEKYLVGWIYTFLIFPVICISLFYLVDYLAFAFKPTYYDLQGRAIPKPILNLFSKATPWFIPAIMFTLFHACTILGAAYFKKLHFIKTTFLFFVLIIVLNVINYPILHVISAGHIQQEVLFMSSKVVDSRYTISASDSMALLAPYAFVLTIIIIWASAFYKLKEKQV
ncbi:hypothetical protein [Mucilaginibacter sp. UYCu711]|uniref:hypothetical protein n=1 Tax=Mucilaginibacter sp. UYCu711 TaxID=3156339 RepID=UPI003D1D6919